MSKEKLVGYVQVILYQTNVKYSDGKIPLNKGFFEFLIGSEQFYVKWHGLSMCWTRNFTVTVLL